MKEKDKYRPVKTFGLLLMVLWLLSTAACIVLLSDSSVPNVLSFFGIVFSIPYLICGIGLFKKKVWGYYLLKCFLFLLLPAFPIGTYIAVKWLKYLKNNFIKEIYFCEPWGRDLGK